MEIYSYLQSYQNNPAASSQAQANSSNRFSLSPLNPAQPKPAAKSYEQRAIEPSVQSEKRAVVPKDGTAPSFVARGQLVDIIA